MIAKVAVYIKSVSNPCGAVNGRDERRTSAPPLILGGAGCRIASHGGIDFRRGGNQSPIAWERKRSQAVVEISLDSGSRSCPPITGGANRLPFIGSTNASIPQPAPKRNPLPERFGSDAAG